LLYYHIEPKFKTKLIKWLLALPSSADVEEVLEIANTVKVQKATMVVSAVNHMEKSKSQTKLVSKISVKRLLLLDFDIMQFDVRDVAQQLTAITFDIFRKIEMEEFFHRNWEKKKDTKAKNVLKLIELFNEISAWVTFTILNETKLRKRVLLYNKHIKIMKQLHLLHNYHLSLAYVCSFSHCAITRLKWTYSKLSKSSKNALKQMESIMSIEESYKKYRQLLNNTSLPCIPAMGVLLMDLTFLEDGNPDKIQNLINFAKYRLMYKELKQIQQFQMTSYNIPLIEEIRNYVLNLNFSTVSDDHLYNLSLSCEPRNATRLDLL